MKIVLVLVALLALIGGGYFFIQSSNLGQAPLGTLVSGNKQELVKASRSFMEDLQYKDFKSAELYSLPEQREKYDIPTLIERLFQVKPEFLNILNYEILSTDFDRSGDRARVHLKANIKVLNANKEKSPELILYYKKMDNKWYMDLASSLK